VHLHLLNASGQPIAAARLPGADPSSVGPQPGEPGAPLLSVRVTPGRWYGADTAGQASREQAGVGGTARLRADAMALLRPPPRPCGAASNAGPGTASGNDPVAEALEAGGLAAPEASPRPSSAQPALSPDAGTGPRTSALRRPAATCSAVTASRPFVKPAAGGRRARGSFPQLEHGADVTGRGEAIYP
jgi:hypothetical protein